MGAPSNNILWIIEDDEAFGNTLMLSLERKGFGVTLWPELPSDEQLSSISQPPDKVILDLKLGHTTSLDFIPRLKTAFPDCAIVVLTGYASINTAVQAVKAGAVNYLAKPASVSDILAAFDGQVSVEQPVEPLSVERLEWEHIQRVLEQSGGNVSEAARRLKMHRRTLQRKLAKRPKQS